VGTNVARKSYKKFAHVNWLQKADCNTKFYHAWVRRERNKMKRKRKGERR
jgi:hypothetical protein